MTVTRRGVVSGLSGSAIAALAAPAIVRAQEAPIRLGFVSSLSDTFSTIGGETLAGAEIAVAQTNEDGGIKGRRLEMTVRDDKGNPNNAIGIVQEYVGDGINLLCGLTSSTTALAVIPLLPQLKAVMIGAAAASDSLTHEAYSPNYFRGGTSSAYMLYRSMGSVLADRYPGAKTWSVIFPDYSFGRSSTAEFLDGLQAYYKEKTGAGVTVNELIKTRFGQTDFKTQIQQLLTNPTDGLYIAVNGTDLVTFWQQATPFNLGKRYKVVMDAGADTLLPRALGKRQPPNTWTTVNWYYDGYKDVPLARRTYDDYVKKTGQKIPTGYVFSGHTPVTAYVGALRKAGSTETPAVMEALRGMKFDTIKGAAQFRAEDNQVIADLNLIELNPSDSVQGWEISNFVKLDGSKFAEPPSPGVAMNVAK